MDEPMLSLICTHLRINEILVWLGQIGISNEVGVCISWHVFVELGHPNE
jgi:hypothetical protein